MIRIGPTEEFLHWNFGRKMRVMVFISSNNCIEVANEAPKNFRDGRNNISPQTSSKNIIGRIIYIRESKIVVMTSGGELYLLTITT